MKTTRHVWNGRIRWFATGEGKAASGRTKREAELAWRRRETIVQIMMRGVAIIAAALKKTSWSFDRWCEGVKNTGAALRRLKDAGETHEKAGGVR